MPLCPNCKSVLSCGCQKRTTSNGTEVCQNCLSEYEKQGQQQKSE